MNRVQVVLVVAAAVAGLAVGCEDEEDEEDKIAYADGTERGACYGNGTCNDGLICLSDLCVKPRPEPEPRRAVSPPVQAARVRRPKAEPSPVEKAPPMPAAEPPATEPPSLASPAVRPPKIDPDHPFDHLLLGTHWLAVNRIGDSVRAGRVKVKREGERLVLDGSTRRGSFDLQIHGVVTPISAKEFDLQGTISGTPDMRWAGESRRRRETKARFRFRAKGARKYWRMYDVNGQDCVCHGGCGNDFCYIDIGFLNR